MRLGIIPDGVRDWLALRSRRFPRPLFDVMGTMLLSRAVMAGVHFGVFDKLARGPKSAEELAKEAGTQTHGMSLLLNALVTCGYLTESAGRYCNSALGAAWLRSDAAASLVNFVRYNYDQWSWMSHLESFIERGEARDIHAKLTEPEWRRYLLGLRDIAALSASELVAKLQFPAPPRSLLDVGGGHCEYVLAMCRRYPGLAATVVDLEPAARVGRELATRAGLAERVTFRIGRLEEADFGGAHDVAFIFNVLHHLDEPAARTALRRISDALAPEGIVVVWESFREERERQRKDQLGALLALFFGVASARQAYTFEQVSQWARAAGFREIRRRTLRTAPFAALLLATK
jgi:2-polyprenyl-3-methyl-5-hydroxy-6-metoxy-1,4-benzoquinol methylase